MRLEVLIITHEGLLGPTGTTEIVPYVCLLADAGVGTRILSFEDPKDLARDIRTEALRSRLETRGVEWTALRSRHGGWAAGTSMDLLMGVAMAIHLARANPPHVVHARSYVAGLIGCAVKLLFRSRLVFGVRGFRPEECVELGLFRPQGPRYRVAKRCEQFLLGASDHVVVLTQAARAILRDREADTCLVTNRVREKQISVIPCLTDLSRFRPVGADAKLGHQHGLSGKIVIGNIGAVNKRYMLHEMFRFAFHLKLHRPETQFVYLTRQEEPLIRDAARDAGLIDDDLLVLDVEPEDVPRWLSLFRLGVFFLRPSYAAKASSCTELAEFLASGVPVVTNTGVGDMDELLGSSQCGVLAAGLREGDLAAAARQALTLLVGNAVPSSVRENCRATAMNFALDEGVRRYLSLFRSLTVPKGEEASSSVAVEPG